MNKPYIVCHMMASVDGRIDCAMTEQLPGVQEYYATLDALEAPTRVSGRVTAELEMARPGAFQSEHHTPLGRTAFSKAAEAEGYEVVVDTHGTLLWDSVPEGERPLLILTSEQVSREYLAYLDRSRISWIACGAERIDLPRACDILAQDEVSVLVGAGVDGRGGQPAVFDGLPAQRPVTPLTLTGVKTYDSGAVWLRYRTVHD